MVPQSKGKMFLADERGLNELEWFRSYNTFNFGRYYNEHKTPFGALYVLNEETLAEGCSMNMQVEEDTHIVLLPVVGAIAWKTSHGHEGMLEAGQAQVLPLPQGSVVEITNPYADTPVQYLQLWIKTPGDAAAAAHRLFSFSPDDHCNHLIPAFSLSSGAAAGLIGKFTGREEAVYTLTHPANGLFAFVLQGAFELQYRLLHAGDGLGIWDLGEIELEALSNDAIILLMEVRLQ